MLKIYTILIVWVCCSAGSFGQTAIKGTVRDVTGHPVAGVSIEHVAGNALTDSLGNFEIQGPFAWPLTLVLRHIAYGETVRTIPGPPDGRLDIAFSLQARSIDEVVVNTGYQSVARERSTGSFATIDRAKFNEQVSPDILSRLEGIASGLVFDRGTSRSETQIMIRGMSTIRGARAPLVVIDNFPYDGDINNINPNDVESVTVLRDAAGSSIWGARAGNGVIVITTKKAGYGQPVRVEANANITAGTKPDLSAIRQMSSSDYIEVERMLYGRNFYNSRINSSSRLPLTPVIETLWREANGQISSAEANAIIDGYRGIDIREEFSKYMYRPPVNQQYSLSFSGGHERGHWQVSSSYDRNTDDTHAGYGRLNTRFRNALKLGNAVELASGLMYTYSSRTAGRPRYGDISHYSTYQLYPYAQFADEAGQALPIVRDYRMSYVDTLGGGRLLDWRYYPLADHGFVDDVTSVHDLLANLDLRVDLQRGLTLDIRYQHERQQTDVRNHRSEQSYFARHTVNRFSQIDPATGTVSHAVPPGGVLDFSGQTLTANNLRGQLNYNRQLENHRVDALLGMEFRARHLSSTSARHYGYDADVLAFGEVDYTRTYPLLVGGARSFIPGNSYLTGIAERFVSAFANVAYTYNGQYTLSASARRDASNLFGVRENQRWQPLWSAGLAWNVSLADFYSWDWLPYLKARVTYGKSGNVDQSQTAVTTVAYQSSNSPFTMLPTARFATYANPDLKWETVNMLNVGLDFSALGDRLSGSLEYFRKNGHDLFGVELVDYTNGTSYSVVRNVASITGKGWDLSLRSLNIDGNRFRWTTDANMSMATEKVKDYHLPVALGRNYVSGTPVISAHPGKAVYGIYSFAWAGLDPENGNPRGLLAGEVSDDYTRLLGTTELSDMAYHGSALPTVYGYLGNTLSYKGLSLSIAVSYKLGYFFRRESIRYQNLFNSGIGHPDYALRWQASGDESLTDVPSLVYPAVANRDTFYGGAAVLVEKADHVRLQYASLSYAFSQVAISSWKVQQLHLYANASNLGILWRANGASLDPDFGLGRNSVLPSKMFAFGIRVFY